MRKTLSMAAAAICCLASLGARADAPAAPYRFELTWSGVGFYCYYKDLCKEVAVGGELPITTPGETGTFHQSFGGYDFTIVTTPGATDPTFADAVISGTLHERAIDGGGLDEYSFYADSTDPFAGYLTLEVGGLLGFVGGAQITQGAPIPEPPGIALLLAALPVACGLVTGRKRRG